MPIYVEDDPDETDNGRKLIERRLMIARTSLLEVLNSESKVANDVSAKAKWERSLFDAKQDIAVIEAELRGFDDMNPRSRPRNNR